MSQHNSKFVFANPSNDLIATIRRSIETNPRVPHQIFSCDLKTIMKITKKSITLKQDVVLVCQDNQLLIPAYDKYNKFWRLYKMPTNFELLLKNIGMSIEESMYFEFMYNNNYRFTPNQHVLMIVEFY